jgi:hypothetical protein
MARDEKIMIRLTTQIKDELQIAAESYGMTMSTLGSYIIGKWLSDQRKIRPLTEKITGEAVKLMGDAITNEAGDMNEFMQKFMAEYMKKNIINNK